MNIGERIKQKRLELNLSQDELAKKVGYKSRSSIQKIEASRNLPLDKVTKMANALECTEAYLMGWEENKDSDHLNQLAKRMEVYAKMLNALPDKEREQINEITEQLVHLTPDERDSVLNLLKVLSPKS